ncbi:SET domain-containing protein [Mollisia scopiformis]|uniref:SET domain-containing protein n=1 Tax=Mollisia scopiformis TaxID=149040 RepID=A0A194WYY2_MOLSC|nr:SET domain-containing protein [Mollisia scopiformis]KUJ13160.1 SET domain-containing protein [Mollisia scopiformis]
MLLSSLLTSSFLFDLINAGQPLDVNFQANFTEIAEKVKVNSTEKVLAAALDVLEGFDDEDFLQDDSRSGYWTHEPECIHNDDHSEEYCVYTDKTFARGRGISFFTSPTIAARVVELSAFTDSAVHEDVNNFEDPPWEIRNVPGRGNGLFATRTLHRGDLILADTPVGVFQSDAFFLDYAIGYRYLHTAFDRLSDATKDIVMRTAAHSPGDPYMERINTNAFAGDFEGAPHFLFYPETALMNHDCRPNTLYHHDTNTLVHSTYASRTILLGEEITITYINILEPRSERRQVLNRWGFECQCSLCSRSNAEINHSDSRIRKINTLQTQLSDWTENSIATPAMAEDLLLLYEEEHIHAAKGIGHMLAALAYNAEGDISLAKKHAKLALESGVVTDGSKEADENDLEAMRKSPKSHWSYLVRKKQRQERERSVKSGR